MLSKLLRHEFRATGRIMLPVYALLLVSCGGCTLFGRLLGRYPESTVLSVVQTVFATLFGVTTFGMLLLTLVLMVALPAASAVLGLGDVYPIIVVIVFLITGFLLDNWHPGWMLFLSIPLYYAISERILGIFW